LKDDIKKNGNPEIVVSLIDQRDKGSHYKELKRYLNTEAGIPH